MLPGVNDIKELLRAYAVAHPRENINEVQSFVNNCSDNEHLYSRKNFNGHITTSALVVNGANEMLFVIHAVFNKLLPPGGHVEDGDQSLKEASMRETKEETGVLAEDLLYMPADPAFPELPFDINSHPIPEHSKKKEPPHVHHDMRYVFRYTGDGNITPDKEETKGAKWLGIHELENVSDISTVIGKLGILRDPD
jgi:8-oxo-dGTP pyrophosphatase MutT (NUDIX family)